MKLCPKCNSSNLDNDNLCSSCGSPLNSINEYGTSGMNNQPVQVKTNGMAVASMVLGIAAIPLLCCCYIGIIPGILAVIFGFVARNRIQTSFGAEKGEGMALAGIILGFSAIGLALILFIYAIATGFSSNNFMNEFQKGFQEGIQGKLNNR